MDVSNEPAREMSSDVYSVSSDTALTNIGDHVDDASFANESFLITSSLPNITNFKHPVDLICEISNTVKSMSSIPGSSEDGLRNSISESGDALDIELDDPDEELQCLMDTIPVPNKKTCDEMTEGSSISQMMIYPRANTPLPELEKTLPTIIIPDSGTLQPLSRYGSFVSVKSITIGNDQETDTLLPLSQCGSFVSVKSITNVSMGILKTDSEASSNIATNTSDNQNTLACDSKVSESSQHYEFGKFSQMQNYPYTCSDTDLTNIHNSVNDGLLMKGLFSITASLPNITVSQHYDDPVQEDCHKNKSSSNITGSSSTNEYELNESVIKSEHTSDRELKTKNEEIHSIIDNITASNKGDCGETLEDSLVSQMMIYPRANTPLPEHEDQLPTIVISDGGTLLPLSRRGSFKSVKSFKIDYDQETGTLQPRSRCGSFVSVKSIMIESEQETASLKPLSKCSSFVSVKSIKIDNDRDVGALKPLARSGSFASVTSVKTNNNHESGTLKPLSQCGSFASIVSINDDNDNESSSDSASQSSPITTMDISQINKDTILVVGSKLLTSSSPSKSNKISKVKNNNLQKNISGKNGKIKTISQFSTLSKSSLSINIVDNMANNNSICELKPIMYTSGLSNSNISINTAGKDQTKKKYLDRNDNGLKVEKTASKEIINPKKPCLDKKSVRCKKILKNLLHTNGFCLDLNMFNTPNKSSPSLSIRYLPLNNKATKHCESKISHTTEIPSSPSQIYLVQYGYPEESLFDGCKCSIM